MSSRFPIPALRIATSGLKYIRSRILNQWGLRLCSRPFGACGPRKPEPQAADTKQMWTFFRAFFALLDRGQVWVAGKTASKHQSRDTGSGAQ